MGIIVSPCRVLAAASPLAAALAFGCSAAPVDNPVRHTRATALFERHCAACHGATGAADSSLVGFLRPRPRSFALGSFNLVSTRNGVPTDDDLVRTLERGLPGSTMPSFAWLPDDDVRLLAQHVRELAVTGYAAARERSEHAAGRSIDRLHLRRAAERALRAGDEIPVPEPQPITDDVVAHGRSLFVERCAACHGRDGKGFGEEPGWVHRTEFAWARDLTAGVLKGGASHRDLCWRIAAGMPAVGMPPTRLDETDTLALAAFVQSLLPADAQDKQVQRRQEIVARRVAALPTDPNDARWQLVDVTLAALQAHAGAVPRAQVAALHDGKECAFLLRWPDAARDDVPTGVFPDGAALQLSGDQDPPAFAMGTRTQQVHIWHWQAYPPTALAGDLDALAPRPDGSRADVPLQPRPAEFDMPQQQAVSAHGSGVGDLRPFRDAAAELSAQPTWRDGSWTLILRRPLRGRSHDDIDLVPGTRLHLALAIWNGAARDAGARKSISVWQRLTLAP
ncbi:MAG: ethylbenzene dehydrogenase-related protein [Planctomycetota bacterium]